jgi:hypothetical protein
MAPAMRAAGLARRGDAPTMHDPGDATPFSGEAI